MGVVAQLDVLPAVLSLAHRARSALECSVLAVVLVPSTAAQDAKTAAAPPDRPRVAFVDVAVVPMDRDAVLPGQTVVVADGRIVALGKSSEVAVPEGALVIDGRGAYLMPGLADMHVHTWNEEDLFVFVANGVTAVRNMFGSPVHLEWRRRIEAGELVGPAIHTAGPIIDGNPPVWPGSVVLEDPARAAEIVAEQADAGYDFLKPYSKLTAAAYDALASAAKSRGMALMGHVPSQVDLAHVVAAGQRTIEHLDGWIDSALAADAPMERVHFQNEGLAWKHVDPEKLIALAKQARESGVWNCPTLVVHQKWVQGDAARELLAQPRMRFVPPATRAAWSPESPWNYLTRLPAEIPASARESVPERMRAVAALGAAGARILAGTDMGNPYVTPGFALHEELANLVSAGLTPYQALRAATAEGAECLGAEWGVVAVGRRADLLLLEANPLTDVANAARRRGVVLRGRWFPESELRDELETRAKRWEGALGGK